MRSLVVAFGLLAFATTAEAKSARPKSKSASVDKKRKQTAKRDTDSRDRSKRSSRSSRADRAAKRGTGRHSAKTKGKRIAHAGRRVQTFRMPRGPIDGQSLGAPWAGRLHDPAELHPGFGYVIRRPWRAFGTKTTVETVERIVSDVADRFYDTHAIAIGDMSAEQGGRISMHASHQSGRDVDIGLIYTKKPETYPTNFVVGTADNLDLEATWVLVEEFAKTHDQSGGVLMIFLDFKVQGLLYNWALENGEDPEYLAKIFQFPHGRGSGSGIVRHAPNHADHIHVRFQCPPDDSICR